MSVEEAALAAAVVLEGLEVAEAAAVAAVPAGSVPAAVEAADQEMGSSQQHLR